MSRSFDATVRARAEREQAARERAERERQQRIQKELELIKDLNEQRARLEDRLSALQQERSTMLSKLESEAQAAREAALAQSARATSIGIASVQGEIQKLEATLNEQTAMHKKTNDMLEAIQKMSAQTFMIYDALEAAFVGWNDMQLESIEAQEAGIVAHFTQDTPDRAVSLEYREDGQGLVALDITEGFEGNDCEVFFESLQGGVEQRGYELVDVTKKPPTTPQTGTTTQAGTTTQTGTNKQKIGG